MSAIYPSLLAADQQKLIERIKELEPICPGFHIDIMDNKFVPNTGISVEKTHEISKETIKKLWIHLMVQNPREYIDQLQLPEDSMVTFHIEAHKEQTKDLIEMIKKKNWLPGIALNPRTGVDELFPFLALIDHVLIMSVEPGFSGQPFVESALAKIDPLVGYRTTSNSSFKICMDGGITVHNIAKIAVKGVDAMAIGSEIFNAKAGVATAYKELQVRCK